MSQKFRKVLICGLGSIGRRHLRIIHHNWPHVKIAVLRSGYGPSCAETKFINQHFSNIKESIDWGPDAAIVSSPANKHIEQAIALAEFGIPCLIEKPIGEGSEKFDNWKKIISLSSKVPMLVGYILRHDPCAILIKKKLDENILGKVVEADFHCGSWLPNWRPGINYLKTVSDG